MFVALNGSDIEPQHCAIDCFEDEVKLVLDLGKCFVNHVETFEDVSLSHGKHVILWIVLIITCLA